MGKLSPHRIACILMLSIALAAGGTLLGVSADEEIPKVCQDAGINLQSACNSDISKASSFFGVSAGQAAQVPQSKIDAYVAANKVSSGCCSAASTFNAAKCNCNAKVQEVAKSFVGGDAGVYSKVVSTLAQSCGFSRIC